MSRVIAAGGRPLFASKIAYEALQIESGEESEEELEEEVPAESRYVVCRVIQLQVRYVMDTILSIVPRKNLRSCPSLLSKRLLVLLG